MAEPATGGPITTTPNTPSSNYDAADEGSLGPWVKLTKSGPCNVNTGRTVQHDWAEHDVWRQT